MAEKIKAIKSIGGKLIFPDNMNERVRSVTIEFSHPVYYRKLHQLLHDNAKRIYGQDEQEEVDFKISIDVGGGLEDE